MRPASGVLILLLVLQAACSEKEDPSDPICRSIVATSTIAPHPDMSFFVTSVGNGERGGNYQGLAGADARCACLAFAMGAGSKTWRAYLSVSLAEKINARDRIGAGPWFNFKGQMIAPNIEGLHLSPPVAELILTETGTHAPAAEHDILTGSDANGVAFDS